MLDYVMSRGTGHYVLFFDETTTSQDVSEFFAGRQSLLLYFNENTHQLEIVQSKGSVNVPIGGIVLKNDSTNNSKTFKVVDQDYYQQHFYDPFIKNGSLGYTMSKSSGHEILLFNKKTRQLEINQFFYDYPNQLKDFDPSKPSLVIQSSDGIREVQLNQIIIKSRQSDPDKTYKVVDYSYLAHYFNDLNQIEI